MSDVLELYFISGPVTDEFNLKKQFEIITKIIIKNLLYNSDIPISHFHLNVIFIHNSLKKAYLQMFIKVLIKSVFIFHALSLM